MNALPTTLEVGGFCLRPVQSTDEPFLLRLFAEGRQAEQVLMGLPSPMWDRFVQSQFQLRLAHYRLTYPQAEHRVIERGGQNLGCLHWNESPSNLHVVDIALLSACQRQGCGSMLMQFLQQRAQSLGVGMSLYVAVDNTAQSWYGRLGFVSDGPSTLHQLMRWSPHSV